MKAKVKLTCAEKSLEYLLLVIKINSRGLLVNFLPKLEVNEAVLLDLRSPTQNKSLQIRGSIYKFIKHPNGNRGTIVQFQQLDSAQRTSIKEFIQTIQTENSPIKTPASDQTELAPPSRNQTLVVPMDSISHLALESPDQEPNFVSSTFDEEDINARNIGLAGSTVIYHQVNPPPSKKQKKRKRWIWFFLFILILFGINFFFPFLKKLRPEAFKNPNQASEEAEKPQPDASQSTAE